jgi:hypothetical protein
MYKNGKKETNETYTLWLTSNPNQQPNSGMNKISGSETNNVIWNVDYDNLFKGRQNLFDHCRVRYEIRTANYASGITFNNFIGYIAANFPSNYNASTTLDTCILGLVNPRTNPTVVSSGNVFILSTLNEIGVDINHKSLIGRQFLNIRWVNDDAISLMSSTLVQNWEILLSFELYN